MKSSPFALYLFVLMILHTGQALAEEPVRVSGNALQPEISVTLSAAQVAFVKEELQQHAATIFSVHWVKDGKVSALPVGGRYVLHGEVLSFVPLHPLGNDLTYEVRFDHAGQVITKRFSTPALVLSAQPARVLSIYPLRDTIPLNTLFFHVRFDQAMSNDVTAYTFVKILDENGKQIERTWRQHSYWLDSMRVLVLMIHPGRVKSGIHYIGPVFETGKKYTLVVTREVKDRNGNVLKEAAQKTYDVAGEDRVLPKITAWPRDTKAGTNEPVRITFSEGMDHASLTEGIKVYNSRNEKVSCIIREKDPDGVVEIIPVNAWEKGRYRLVCESLVSDFAANRINRAFEITDIREKEKDSMEVINHFKAK